ncbi:MAG: hypothetical protein ACLQVL_30870 [Terriglobia bacterium]
MKSRIMTSMFGSAMTVLMMLAAIPPSPAQEGKTTNGVPVKMTVTVNVASDKRMPEINQQDVVVKQGKQRLQVAEWVPAQGDRAGLDLFILIDDASDTRLGSHLGDLRKFINAQPATTTVGVGYMRNATVQIAQNFTRDHAAAAKAVRLPLGTPGAYGSPYLSVIDLMQRWPESPNRREVVMVTDGIDRARRGMGWRGLNIVPDVDSAGEVAMRTGTMIHTIYVPGVGRWHRNYWEATNGQLGIAKLSDMTGGESYYLGLQRPVTIAPYLDDLQKVLDNQYLLSFSTKPGQKAGLQYVSLNTEVAGVEFAAPDAVWVVAAN